MNARQRQAGSRAAGFRVLLGRLPRAQLASAGASLGSLGGSAPAASRGFNAPRGLRLSAVVLAGAAGAATVGYVTASNEYAAPLHAAVVLRVLIIVNLIVSGAWAVGARPYRPMGRLLLIAGFFSCLWLLNGSARSLSFSIGVACAGVGPAVFAYILLAHPGGRLETRLERMFVATVAPLMIASWEFCWLTSTHPPFATPLLRCGSHCPRNAFFVGSSAATPALVSLCSVLWVSLAAGTALLLVVRMRFASPPLRRALTPTLIVAMFSTLFLLGFLVSPQPKTRMAEVFGYLHVGVAAVIPLAVLLGLGLERQYMGGALARFVDQLAGVASSRVQGLMADVLHDPSLTIAYRRPRLGTYVDASGTSVQMPREGSSRAIAEIARDGEPVASVLYDRSLADQEPFVRAAGAAAALRLQELQLEADLKASMTDLARSRRRLVEAADAERERIERDLHDGAQQHLVGMRVKLELATGAMKDDRSRGERMLAEIGEELEEALDELRSLAQGVYPPLLAEHGLVEALKSAARQSSTPISVSVRELARYPDEIETAVYFCCREALQNVAKHAGAHASGRLLMREHDGRLSFEIADSGAGFDVACTLLGHGVVNMRDRIEAVGGTLEVRSAEGHGTVVAGVVPVPAHERRPVRAWRQEW